MCYALHVTYTWVSVKQKENWLGCDKVAKYLLLKGYNLATHDGYNMATSNVGKQSFQQISQYDLLQEVNTHYIFSLKYLKNASNLIKV